MVDIRPLIGCWSGCLSAKKTEVSRGGAARSLFFFLFSHRLSSFPGRRNKASTGAPVGLPPAAVYCMIHVRCRLTVTKRPGRGPEGLHTHWSAFSITHDTLRKMVAWFLLMALPGACRRHRRCRSLPPHDCHASSHDSTIRCPFYFLNSTNTSD